MPNIEKVLKGLECCAECQRCAGDCPYDDDDDNCEKCTSELAKDALELLKSQKAEIERLTLSGKWKRMSDLPIEKDDRFECSICGNVVHYNDKINLYTFNDYCGRCGAYNGFQVKDGEQ